MEELRELAERFMATALSVVIKRFIMGSNPIFSVVKLKINSALRPSSFPFPFPEGTRTGTGKETYILFIFEYEVYKKNLTLKITRTSERELNIELTILFFFTCFKVGKFISAIVTG